jgi:hypothetical protein
VLPDERFIEYAHHMFADTGLPHAEGEELTTNSHGDFAVKDVMMRQRATQNEAAKIDGTEQPTLPKVPTGGIEGVTMGRGAGWLTALGREAEIRVTLRGNTGGFGGSIVYDALHSPHASLLRGDAVFHEVGNDTGVGEGGGIA